jgi:LmbE family N-acetylglucosaminyl deacetylase
MWQTRSVVALAVVLAQSAAAGASSLAFQPGDRVLVLAPHPDDESLGCGGILHEAVRAGIPVHVVFLTNGDANELSFLVWERHPVVTSKGAVDMGRLRGEEARRATRALGLPADALTFLGYPDAGTMPMWTRGWGAHPPYESLITRVTAVPYQTALRPGAPYKPESVLEDVQTVLRKFRPTRLFVSHPADAHADHRACYLYAMAALWETPDVPAPTVYPYLIHYNHWPGPSADPAVTPLEPPPLLGQEIAWQQHVLDAGDLDAKRAALEAYATQNAYNRRFMLGLVRANELFGDFTPAVLRTPDAARDLLAGPASATPDPRIPATPHPPGSFVGIVWRRVERHGASVTLTAELSRRLLPGTYAVFYLFGARPDRPFAGMPKLRVTIGPLGSRVADRDTPLPKAPVAVGRSGRRLAVTVPMTLLGEPRRLLIGADTGLADVPMHSAGWRIIELDEWAGSGSRPTANR